MQAQIFSIFQNHIWGVHAAEIAGQADATEYDKYHNAIDTAKMLGATISEPWESGDGTKLVRATFPDGSEMVLHEDGMGMVE